jgi:hypothetical protein
MNFRILASRYNLGQYVIIILMVIAWLGITFPIQFLNTVQSSVPLAETINSTLTANDTLIILQDDGTLLDREYPIGVEIITRSPGANIEVLTMALVERYCSASLDAKQLPENLFLAWSSKDRNAIYALGPTVRPLYLFFYFSRIIGTEGQLFHLAPRNNILQSYCSVASMNQGVPTIVILNDSIYPMMSSVQTREILWMRFQEASQSPDVLVDQVDAKEGFVLLDSSIEIEPDHPFLLRFATNNQPIGSGALLQISP